MKRSLAIVWLIVTTGCGSGNHEASKLALNSPDPTQSESTETATPDDTSVDVTGPATGIYLLKANSLEGELVDLESYKGKVTLIVNVASNCGYTPQYVGLQKLHQELEGKGFSVLAFPSNEFGGQEPGSPEEIRDLCTSKYEVTFPIFSKIRTKSGNDQSPIYQSLHAETDKLPNWNFCKYLVGRDGKVLGYFPSKVAPDDRDLRIAIDKALK